MIKQLKTGVLLSVLLFFFCPLPLSGAMVSETVNSTGASFPMRWNSGARTIRALNGSREVQRFWFVNWYPDSTDVWIYGWAGVFSLDYSKSSGYQPFADVALGFSGGCQFTKPMPDGSVDSGAAFLSGQVQNATLWRLFPEGGLRIPKGASIHFDIALQGKNYGQTATLNYQVQLLFSREGSLLTYWLRDEYNDSAHLVKPNGNWCRIIPAGDSCAWTPSLGGSGQVVPVESLLHSFGTYIGFDQVTNNVGIYLKLIKRIGGKFGDVVSVYDYIDFKPKNASYVPITQIILPEPAYFNKGDIFEIWVLAYHEDDPAHEVQSVVFDVAVYGYFISSGEQPPLPFKFCSTDQ